MNFVYLPNWMGYPRGFVFSSEKKAKEWCKKKNSESPKGSKHRYYRYKKLEVR